MRDTVQQTNVRRAFALALCAFVATRVLLVLSVADVFGYGEEFAKGAAAKAMLDGIGVEHHRLAYVYHEGGGFVVSHLTALLFLVMGPSVLTIKIAALLTSSLVLVAALAFSAEHLDRRSLGALAAAFVLAPIGVQRASLLSLGTHFAAMLFVLPILGLAIRIASRPRAEPCRPRDLWSLGLCSGFGLYVSALVAPAIAVAALALAAGRPGPRAALRAAAGFAIGALPLWTMLALVGSDTLRVRGEGSIERPHLSALESLVSLVGPIALSRDVWVWAAAAVTVALAAVGLARASRTVRTVVLGYLGLHALAYISSGLALRHVWDHPVAWMLALRQVPFWLFGVLFAAAGAATLWRRGSTASRLCAAAFALVLVPGVRAYVALLREARPAHPLENLSVIAGLRGYSYPEYFPAMRVHLEGELDERAAVLLRLEDDPALVLPAIAEHIYVETWMRTPDEVGRNAQLAFGERADLALLGSGRALQGSWTADFEAAFQRLQSQPEATRRPLAEALGRNGLHSRFKLGDLDRLVEVPVPEQWRHAFLEGVGWRLQQTLRLRPDLAARWLAAQESARLPALQAGYERALALDRL